MGPLTFPEGKVSNLTTELVHEDYEHALLGIRCGTRRFQRRGRHAWLADLDLVGFDGPEAF